MKHDPLKFDPRMFMNSEQRARVMAEREALTYDLHEFVEIVGQGKGYIVEVLDDGFKVELQNGSIRHTDKRSLRKTAQPKIGSMIELDSKYPIGASIVRHGRTYRVTECRYVSPSEVADLEDQDTFVDAGWHTTAVLEK